MRTVVESPQARFRREAGLPPKTGGSRPRVSDWLNLNCGDCVYRLGDPRHIGRVEAILHGALVKVKWDGSGWFEFIALRDLERLPMYRRP